MFRLKLLCLFCATSLSLCENTNEEVSQFKTPSNHLGISERVSRTDLINAGYQRKLPEVEQAIPGPYDPTGQYIKATSINITKAKLELIERRNKEKLDEEQKERDELTKEGIKLTGHVIGHHTLDYARDHPGVIVTILEGLFAGLAFIVSNVCFCAWYRKRREARAIALPTNIEAGEMENPSENFGSQEQLQENVRNSTTHDGPILIRPLPPYAGQDAANSTTYDGPVLISPLPSYTEIMEKRQKATTS